MKKRPPPETWKYPVWPVSRAIKRPMKTRARNEVPPEEWEYKEAVQNDGDDWLTFHDGKIILP